MSNKITSISTVKNEADLIAIASDQIKQIFPSTQTESHLMTGNIPSLIVDISAHSTNNRLIIFEVKYVQQGKKLPHTAYPSIAHLKDSMTSMSPEFPPIVVVLTNVLVDSSVRNIFAKSGIPVVTLSQDARETKERLSTAFQQLAIDLPEFSGIYEIPKTNNLCLVMLPAQPEYEMVYRHAIEPAIKHAGLEPLNIVQPARIEFQQYSDSFKRSKVIVVDASEHDIDIFLGVGFALGLQKDIIIISQNPVDIHESVVSLSPPPILYQNSPDGITKLENILTEALVVIQRKQSRGNL